MPGPLTPQWINAMANRRRKTLVVCADCHGHIHTGHPTATAPLTQ
ncbi:HNH endonuclease [Nocardia sp. NPDC004123]